MPCCSTEAGYHRAIGRQVLGKVHFCLRSHELSQVAFGASSLPLHKFCGTPPARKDGLLLRGEGERGRVT